MLLGVTVGGNGGEQAQCHAEQRDRAVSGIPGWPGGQANPVTERDDWGSGPGDGERMAGRAGWSRSSSCGVSCVR
jgi:hypothetical protein